MRTADERSIPTRWRANPGWSESWAAPLRLLAGPGAKPSATDIAALQDGLWRRDEAAAALVRAVREEHAVTMPQFRKALADGITDESPAPLRKFFDLLGARPDWVDDALLRRGAHAARRVGWDGWDILAYGSLLGGYRGGAGLEPLVRSGRLSGPDVLRRVGETGQWWLGCTAPDGMERFGDGWKLCAHVRVMHAFINYQLEQDPDWDWGYHGVPINQVDQAGTIGSFSTSHLIHARLLGVRLSRRDADAVMHLFSYAGWLMGVDEQWLPRDEATGRRVLYRIISTYPGPDENSRKLAARLFTMTDDYHGHGRLRRRFERERAFSLATLLVGPAGIRQLGGTVRPPWYPLYRMASNVLWTHVVGRLPGGSRVLDHRAARALRIKLRMLYGDRPGAIGPDEPVLANRPA